jgi:hypothetical protein
MVYTAYIVRTRITTLAVEHTVLDVAVFTNKTKMNEWIRSHNGRDLGVYIYTDSNNKLYEYHRMDDHRFAKFGNPYYEFKTHRPTTSKR